jgi:hypothetical protein
MHTPAPASENLPAEQMDAVAITDPATHANPALQFPLHAGADRPAKAPNRPGAHAAVHAAIVSPVVFPNRPAGQSTHTPAPNRLYQPTGQMAAVALVEPATQRYPAVQFPLHAAFVRPCTLPNTPAGQSMHAAAPDRLYWPTGQAVHTPAPAALYDPAGHTNVVGTADPAGHACPAVQLLLQALVRAVALLHVPAVQLVHVSARAGLYRPAGQMDAVALAEPVVSCGVVPH